MASTRSAARAGLTREAVSPFRRAQCLPSKGLFMAGQRCAGARSNRRQTSCWLTSTFATRERGRVFRCWCSRQRNLAFAVVTLSVVAAVFVGRQARAEGDVPGEPRLFLRLATGPAFNYESWTPSGGSPGASYTGVGAGAGRGGRPAGAAAAGHRGRSASWRRSSIAPRATSAARTRSRTRSTSSTH